MNKLSNTEKLGFVKLSFDPILGSLIGAGVGAFGKRDNVYYDKSDPEDPTIKKPKTRKQVEELTIGLEPRRRKVIRNILQGGGIGLGAAAGTAVGAGLGAGLAGYLSKGYVPSEIADIILGVPWENQDSIKTIGGGIGLGLGGLAGLGLGAYSGWKLPRMALPLAKDQDKKIKEQEENKDNA